ncbi:MAG: hypothetical protein IKR95_02145 [Oscillospiraceae bacterium]|nr:hypothetical protein [Oscillospiraceae bacterium]
MGDIVMNNGGKYGRHFIQDVHEPSHYTAEDSKRYKTFADRILYIDSNILPEAFQMNTVWYHGPFPAGGRSEHTHDFPELLGYYSSDPDDPDDLGAEVEFAIEGERHILTKSTMIFIPPGVKHLPIALRNIRRPVFHFGVCLNSEYSANEEAKGAESVTDAAGPAGETGGNGADAVMNDGGKYGKYFIQKVHEPAHMTPEKQEAYRKFARRIMYMDTHVVPGAFQMNSSWYFGLTPDGPGHGEHTHDSAELIGFLSSDPNDRENLGAEVEFAIEGENHLLNKSTMIFVPAGMKHLPMIVKNVKRPILHFSICLEGEYVDKPTGR